MNMMRSIKWSILLLVCIVTLLFPITSNASIITNDNDSATTIDSTPTLRKTLVVSGQEQSNTFPLDASPSSSSNKNINRFLQTTVVEDDTCGGWFLNPEPDGNGCKVSSGGIAIIATIVAIINIGIIIASCACCACCPFYSSLCCAEPAPEATHGTGAAAPGLHDDTEK
jgi:hypothetical protein